MRRVLSAVLALSTLAGCAVSPSLPFFGAFFPGWLLCVTGALFLTLIIRAVLIKAGRADSLGPPVLAYPLLTAGLTLVFWILVFGN